MAESIDAQLEAAWYVAVNDGQADGPLRTQDVKQRLQEGIYTARHLAWRQGMTDWLPIASISDFGLSTSNRFTRPFAWMPVDLLAGRAEREFMLLLVVGRTALVLALATLAISMLAWLWGLSWFEHAYLLILIFAICEGQAGIWKALLRPQSPPARAVTPEQIKA